MKIIVTSAFVFLTVCLQAQRNQTLSPLDGRAWGVVLQHPATKNVIVKADIPYLSDSKGTLKLDVYLPPDFQKTAKRPVIVFLNAIGDQPGEMRLKNWGIYESWPQLVAAHGYIGISMECDGSHIQESLKGVFSFIETSGIKYGIDKDRVGVYAASANVAQSMAYLMGDDAYKGIKAAALYYGNAPLGPYRKDLPVLFIVAEGDVPRNNYGGLWNEVLKNNAPWTIKMASNMIHAFDAFTDNDEARTIIKETISFWKNHLDPIPAQSGSKSLGREILAAQYGHDDAKTIELLEKWLPDHPKDKEGLFQYASALKNLNRLEESEKAYRKLVDIDPNNASALTYLYLILNNLNRVEEAEPFLERAEKTGRIDKFMYMGMAYSMYRLNRHKEGVKFFEKVVAQDPSGVNCYNLACGYAKTGDPDKAIEMLQKSIEAGFTSRQQFENDTDLDSIKNDPRFKGLLEKLK